MKTIMGDTRRLVLLGTAILVITAVVVALLLSGWLDSGDEGPNGLDAEALARGPGLALDMDPAGNTYDDATNSMALGPTTTASRHRRPAITRRTFMPFTL